jgi:hypothetical protein
MGVVELRVQLLRWCQSAYGTCDPRLLQRRCCHHLVRRRGSTCCACVERAGHSLPAESSGAPRLHLETRPLWAHRPRRP